MRVAVSGFAKYLRKSPPDDRDITEALTWVRDMADQVLNPAALVGLSDAEMDQLDFQDELAAQAVEDQLTFGLEASEIVEVTT